MEKRHIQCIQVAILFLVILSSCSRENKIWDLVASSHDITSYEFYLENYPQGAYADSAKVCIDGIKALQKEKPLIIQKIVPTPVASWDNKLCTEIGLKISVSFPQSPGLEKAYREKGFEILKDYFEKRGIRIIPMHKGCETQLLVDFKIRSLGASYFDLGYFYTGYDIQGSFLLKTDDKMPIKLAVSEKLPKAKVVEKKTEYGFTKYKADFSGRAGREPDAPLPDLKDLFLNKNFMSQLWETQDTLLSGEQMAEYYTNYLYRCFCDANKFVRGQAMSVMMLEKFERKPGEMIQLITYNLNNYCLADTDIEYCNLGLEILNIMGPDAIEAVPVLIEYMASRKEKSLDNNYVEEVLEKISGRKNEIKNDISAWRSWWLKI
ncbi:MAG: hypothetical protein WC395_08350 [Bacteroidales bacterium]|jgi:hypothetical protein